MTLAWHIRYLFYFSILCGVEFITSLCKLKMTIKSACQSAKKSEHSQVNRTPKNKLTTDILGIIAWTSVAHSISSVISVGAAAASRRTQLNRLSSGSFTLKNYEKDSFTFLNWFFFFHTRMTLNAQNCANKANVLPFVRCTEA